MRHLAPLLLLLALTACHRDSKSSDVSHEDSSWVDHNGRWHPSLRNQSLRAQFLRENHCVVIRHLDQTRTVDDFTTDHVTIRVSPAFAIYMCPGISGQICLDDSEIQP